MILWGRGFSAKDSQHRAVLKEFVDCFFAEIGKSGKELVERSVCGNSLVGGLSSAAIPLSPGMRAFNHYPGGCHICRFSERNVRDTSG